MVRASKGAWCRNPTRAGGRDEPGRLHSAAACAFGDHAPESLGKSSAQKISPRAFGVKKKAPMTTSAACWERGKQLRRRIGHGPKPARIALSDQFTTLPPPMKA